MSASDDLGVARIKRDAVAFRIECIEAEQVAITLNLWTQFSAFGYPPKMLAEYLYEVTKRGSSTTAGFLEGIETMVGYFTTISDELKRLNEEN